MIYRIEIDNNSKLKNIEKYRRDISLYPGKINLYKNGYYLTGVYFNYCSFIIDTKAIKYDEFYESYLNLMKPYLREEKLNKIFNDETI